MGTNPKNRPDIRQGSIPFSNKLLDRVCFLQEQLHAILCKNFATFCTLPESTNFHHFRSKESAQIEVCLWKMEVESFKKKPNNKLCYILLNEMIFLPSTKLKS
jgi:hypothetical protein